MFVNVLMYLLECMIVSVLFVLQTAHTLLSSPPPSRGFGLVMFLWCEVLFFISIYVVD